MRAGLRDRGHQASLLCRPTLGKRHLVTFATDAPRGFDDDHIAVLAEILPPLLWSVKSV